MRAKAIKWKKVESVDLLLDQRDKPGKEKYKLTRPAVSHVAEGLYGDSNTFLLVVQHGGKNKRKIALMV